MKKTLSTLILVSTMLVADSITTKEAELDLNNIVKCDKGLTLLSKVTDNIESIDKKNYVISNTFGCFKKESILKIYHFKSYLDTKRIVKLAERGFGYPKAIKTVLLDDVDIQYTKGLNHSKRLDKLLKNEEKKTRK